jgi:hypothetical protein
MIPYENQLLAIVAFFLAYFILTMVVFQTRRRRAKPNSEPLPASKEPFGGQVVAALEKSVFSPIELEVEFGENRALEEAYADGTLPRPQRVYLTGQPYRSPQPAYMEKRGWGQTSDTFTVLTGDETGTTERRHLAQG